ncbi:MAG TPA: hypothetical protein VN714_05120 [Trebonia sp.]|jgi:hypothetical protein|nr:hypothetical protein [Trebonia sp.]
MNSTLSPASPLRALHFKRGRLPEQPVREPRLRHGEPVAGSPRPHQPRAGWAMARLRRVKAAFRHVNAELMLMAELMRHPAGAPRPQSSAGPYDSRDGHQAAASGQADRAA